GWIDDAGLHQVGVFAGGNVVAFVAFAFLDFFDNQDRQSQKMGTLATSFTAARKTSNAALIASWAAALTSTVAASLTSRRLSSTASISIFACSGVLVSWATSKAMATVSFFA